CQGAHLPQTCDRNEGWDRACGNCRASIGLKRLQRKTADVLVSSIVASSGEIDCGNLRGQISAMDRRPTDCLRLFAIFLDAASPLVGLDHRLAATGNARSIGLAWRKDARIEIWQQEPATRSKQCPYCDQDLKCQKISPLVDQRFIDPAAKALGQGRAQV